MVEKVQKLTELCYNDTMSNRFVALNDLTKKIRACFNALYLLPLEQNDVLCVPVNLMYRCIVSDLMTTLFIAVVTGKTDLPRWACIFNSALLYIPLFPLRIGGTGNWVGAIMFLGLFALI